MIFDSFSIIFNIFDPGILKFIFQRSIVLQRKIAKNIIYFLLVKYGNFANWIKNHYFLYGFYSWWSKNNLKNKEKLDFEAASSSRHMNPHVFKINLYNYMDFNSNFDVSFSGVFIIFDMCDLSKFVFKTRRSIDTQPEMREDHIWIQTCNV